MTPAVVEELESWIKQLRAAADNEHEALVDPADQLSIENCIAVGIALLAGEEAPRPALVPSERPIRAHDLAMTADLVRRALEAQS